jgi:hypothetical protein
MKGVCYYCQQKFWPKLALSETYDAVPVLRTKDHIIPISRGGIKGMKNVIPACQRCNRIKDNLMPEEFLEALLFMKQRKDHTVFDSMDIEIVIDKTRELIETIAPYRGTLFYKEPVLIIDATIKSEPPVEWPEPEPVGFDWTLPLKELDRKYNPASKNKKAKMVDPDTIKPIHPQILAAYERAKNPQKEPFLAFLKKLSKYEHIYNLLINADSDLPRWLYENMM